jgi:hypothetical protein
MELLRMGGENAMLWTAKPWLDTPSDLTDESLNRILAVLSKDRMTRYKAKAIEDIVGIKRTALYGKLNFDSEVGIHLRLKRERWHGVARHIPELFCPQIYKWVGASAPTGKDNNLSCCAAIRVGASAPTHFLAFLNIVIEAE